MENKALAAEKAAAYVEGYRQCLEDVLNEVADLAAHLAKSSCLESATREAFADTAPYVSTFRVVPGESLVG